MQTSFPNAWDLDSDNDGLADRWEVDLIDDNSDGVADQGTDTTDNGWLSAARSMDTTDSDQDGIKDRIDRDSDQDGFYDLYESTGFPSSLFTFDNTPDGQIDTLDQVRGFVMLVDSYADIRNSDKDDYPDHRDLDSDDDGLSDYFEGAGDREENLAGNPIYEDMNGDGANDTMMIDFTLYYDYDQDGVLNHIDRDSDQDGVPDIFESRGIDADGDNYTDKTADDIIVPGWILAAQSGTRDSDWDGYYDHEDRDSDNDGIPDVSEASGIYMFPLGKIEYFTDSIRDGWDDSLQFDSPLNTDVENPDVPQGDNIPDLYDSDSDNDGIFDYLESDSFAVVDDYGRILNVQPDSFGWDFNKGVFNPLNSDQNEEAPPYLPNYRDWDSDGDGVADYVEYEIPHPDPDSLMDCNNDGILNFLDSKKCRIKFFKGLSPNGDGLNDEFLAIGIESYDSIAISIYNRWGRLVYEESNWNGIWLGNCDQPGCYGNRLPDGVYYYICRFGDNDGEFGNGDTHRSYVYLKTQRK